MGRYLWVLALNWCGLRGLRGVLDVDAVGPGEEVYCSDVVSVVDVGSSYVVEGCV